MWGRKLTLVQSENVIGEDDDFVKKDPDAQQTAPPALESEAPAASHGPVIADVLSDEPDSLSLHSNPPPLPAIDPRRRRVQSAPRTRLQRELGRACQFDALP